MRRFSIRVVFASFLVATVAQAAPFFLPVQVSDKLPHAMAGNYSTIHSVALISLIGDGMRIRKETSMFNHSEKSLDIRAWHLDQAATGMMAQYLAPRFEIKKLPAAAGANLSRNAFARERRKDPGESATLYYAQLQPFAEAGVDAFVVLRPGPLPTDADTDDAVWLSQDGRNPIMSIVASMDVVDAHSFKVIGSASLRLNFGAHENPAALWLDDLDTLPADLSVTEEQSVRERQAAGEILELSLPVTLGAVGFPAPPLPSPHSRAVVAYNLGVGYDERGEGGAARGEYSVAIYEDPTLQPAYLNRGVSYKNLGNYPAALSDFAEALRLKPDDWMVFYNRGNTYRLIGNYPASLADLDRAVSLAPQRQEVWLGRCDVRAVANQLDDAMADCNRALSIQPGAANALTARAYAYLRLGKVSEALADAEKASAQPGSDHAIYLRGVARSRSGNSSGAADIEAAKARDPKIPALYPGLGL